MIPITNQKVADLAGVRFDSEQILSGPIIYSRTHEVRKQFKQLARMGPCILLTSFSDASVDWQLARKLPKNVKRWYSNNVDAQDERVRPLPIGLRFNDTIYIHFLPRYERGHRKDVNLCSMCFLRNIPRNPNPREGIYEQFGAIEWITTKGGFEHVSIEEFYDDMQTHTYTISPPGAGLDCHRHWEAMALGCIPIVLRSTVTELLLHDMPALIIDNWDEVTRDRLEYELPELSKRFGHVSMDKLSWECWEKQIREDRECLLQFAE